MHHRHLKNFRLRRAFYLYFPSSNAYMHFFFSPAADFYTDIYFLTQNRYSPQNSPPPPPCSRPLRAGVVKNLKFDAPPPTPPKTPPHSRPQRAGVRVGVCSHPAPTLPPFKISGWDPPTLGGWERMKNKYQVKSGKSRNYILCLPNRCIG